MENVCISHVAYAGDLILISKLEETIRGKIQ